MQGLPFRKMHGLGNDCVVLDARARPIELSAAAIRRIGDRHRGVGFDQLVLLRPAADAAAALLFFNADGSAAGACGNATRCVARLLMDELGVDALELDSPGGRLAARRAAGGHTTVLMPAPRLDWRDIPLAEPMDTLALPIELEGLARPVAVSMGNPHAVFFTEALAGLDVARLGAALERHPLFPDRANIGFAQLLDDGRLRLRVFERGAGLTQACGSGACAALVAARRRGLVGDQATLLLDGGALEIGWPGAGPVAMTGPTSQVYTGLLDPALLAGAEP
jgi:diaminopimelate epimerase